MELRKIMYVMNTLVKSAKSVLTFDVFDQLVALLCSSKKVNSTLWSIFIRQKVPGKR